MAGKCCLSIAGSDSGGNAGVQADIRAFHAYGMHACTVITSLTAQNPFGVSAIHAVPADFVDAQLDAVFGAYDVAALKTGMLNSASVAETVARRMASLGDGVWKVVDPVMVATSGASLVDGDAMAAIREMLLPAADVMTPNLPEAEALCGGSADDAGRRAGAGRAKELAKKLYDAYGCAVVVKGGHGAGSTAVDVLYDGEEMREFAMPWIREPVSTHGTGCTFAAALACELALGAALPDAVDGAKRHVHAAISAAYEVGPRCGVLGFAPGSRQNLPPRRDGI